MMPENFNSTFNEAVKSSFSRYATLCVIAKLEQISEVLLYLCNIMKIEKNVDANSARKNSWQLKRNPSMDSAAEH